MRLPSCHTSAAPKVHRHWSSWARGSVPVHVRGGKTGDPGRRAGERRCQRSLPSSTTARRVFQVWKASSHSFDPPIHNSRDQLILGCLPSTVLSTLHQSSLLADRFSCSVGKAFCLKDSCFVVEVWPPAHRDWIQPPCPNSRHTSLQSICLGFLGFPAEVEEPELGYPIGTPSRVLFTVT